MADPLSNGSLEKRLQKVIDAIVGAKALKAKIESLEYINELMSRRGSSGQIISTTPQWMETLIVDVLNKIIVKHGFTLELNGKKDETPDVNSTDTAESVAIDETMLEMAGQLKAGIEANSDETTK